MTLTQVLVLTVAAIAGGALNTAAAGGGVLTLLACLAVGMPPQVAIATSQVAIPASFLGGIVPSWRQRRQYRPIVPAVVAAAIGTGLGVWVVSRVDAHTFQEIAPWLLGVAGLLLVVQPLLQRLPKARNRDLLAVVPGGVGGGGGPRPGPPPTTPVVSAELGSRRQVGLVAALFVTALYGGGFGGGVGVAVLLVLATVTGWNWQTTNTVKNGLCLVMSLVCSGVFLAVGHPSLSAVLVLVVGQLVGGRVGASVVHRFSEDTLRRAVAVATAIGIVAMVGNS